MEATDTPLRGTTEVLPYNSEIEAVHMALLRTGKIIYYSGFRKPTREETQTRIWNPQASPSDGDRITNPLTPTDLFCAGHAFLPDGRLLSTGGTMEYRRMPRPFLVKFSLAVSALVPRKIQIAMLDRQNMEFTGPRFLDLFDPDEEQWDFAGYMQHGRWYPTNCVLPDGGLLILSGRDEGGGYKRHLDKDAKEKIGKPDYPARVRINRDVEVFYPDRGLEYKGEIRGPGIRPEMGMMAYAGHHHIFPTEYPRLHVLPLTHRSNEEKETYNKGRVFCAGYGPETKMLNLDTWEWEHVDELREEHPRHDGNCVLLPLDYRDNYRARVMTFCGSWEKALRATALDTVEIIDFSDAYPAWRYLRDESGEIVHIHPRVHGAAILLPDGKVMAIGGNREARWDKPIHDVDVFDPETDTWETDHTPIKVERGYHATAMLLPDARILVSGTTPASHRELRMEVYTPYYLDGDPMRPEIMKVSAGKRAPDGDVPQLTYGALFEIHYRNLDREPARAALVRPGAMTHAFDMDQRHIWLEVIKRDDDILEAIAPPDPHVAPPGYYMLFLLDGNGTPSQAVFVHLPVIPLG
jgi:hypothetical protein